MTYKISPKIDVITSKTYSNLIFKININKIFASDKNFQKDVQKSREVLVNQLRFLSRKGYLLTEKPKKKLKNRTLYYVNWDKIFLDFIDYLNLKIEEKRKELLNLLKNKKYAKIHYWFRENLEDLNLAQIIVNNGLIKHHSFGEMMMWSFYNFSQLIDYNYSIKDFFRFFIICLSHAPNSSIKRIYENNLKSLQMLCAILLDHPTISVNINILYDL